MINPWVLLGLLIAWIGSMATVGYWQNGVGKESERVVWQARENVELSEANAMIIMLQNKAREDEATHNQVLADISRTYQERINDADIQKDKFIAGVRNGTIVLRQPAPRTEKASGGISSEAIASAIGRDGETNSKLSDETAEFLYTEANRADKIVEQLAACQAIVIEDRKLCNSDNN